MEDGSEFWYQFDAIQKLNEGLVVEFRKNKLGFGLHHLEEFIPISMIRFKFSILYHMLLEDPIIQSLLIGS